MPFLFLVPAVLAGFAAIAIPVLMHLRRREREKPMRFPSLMFLQRVTIATARRRRVTDLPLLLLRALIVALLVLAFARPVMRPRPDALHDRGGRRVVIALDRSLSMSHTAVWPAALDSARALLHGLAAGDRVAIIAFDDDAVVEQPLTADHALALNAINHVTPGSRGTRFGAPIRAARELLLKEADRSGGEILLVTDLQRAGSVGLTGVTLPPAVLLRAVDASPRPHGNASVAAVTVQQLAGKDDARARLVVAAQLASKGLAAPRRTRATLLVGGRPAGTREVTLPADGDMSIHFDPVPLPVSGARVVVALDPDSLVADDSFRVVVPAQAIRRVIMVAPGDAQSGETLYLQRALESGDDPALRIERRNPATLDATLLHDAAAVILFDVPVPGGAAGTALAAWVHDGGGLIVAAGRRMAGRGSPGALLPGTMHGLVDRTGDHGGALAVTALEHPAFSPFRGPGAPIGAARLYRYPRLAPTVDAQLLARFDDGTPALLERAEGQGRVLLLAAPLDAVSGDFPLQPAYLPFVRALTLYAAGDAAGPMFRTAGDGWPLPGSVRNPVIVTPAGTAVRPELARIPGAFGVDDAGFYSLYESRPSGDPVATVAVNPPGAESDLTAMDPSGILVGVGQDSVPAGAITAATIVDAERRQQLWRILLLFAAAAIVIELVVASTGWRGAAAQVAGAATDGGPSS